MKKMFLSIAWFLAGMPVVYGQCTNLITNGNFDQLQTCSSSCCGTSIYPCAVSGVGTQEINKSLGWTHGPAVIDGGGAGPVVGTPDFYHVNSTFIGTGSVNIEACGGSCTGRPKNCYSHTTAYTRVQVDNGSPVAALPTGESILGTINTPLQNGTIYTFSAKVHHKSDGHDCDLAVRLRSSSNALLNVPALVLTGVPNQSSTACDWVTLSGIFVLSDPDVASLDLIEIGGYYNGTHDGALSQIYIDDVKLEAEIEMEPVPNPIICKYECTTISSGIPHEYSSCATYSWTPAGTPNVAYPTVCPSVTTTYNCVVTYGTQTFNTSVTVTVNPVPVIHVNPPTGPFCAGSPITLDADATLHASLEWSDNHGNTFSGNPVVVYPPVGPTVYTVTATGSNGCESQAFVSINVNALPHVTANLEYEAQCDEAPILLGKKNILSGNMYWTNGFSPLGVGASFNPATYIYTTTSGTIASYYFNPSANPPGTYNIVYNYTDPVTGCANQAVGHITVPEPPLVTITGNLNLCDWTNGTDLGAKVVFSPDPYTYEWSPGGQTTPLIHVTTPGTYSVTVTNTVTHCSTTATVTVTMGSEWHQYTENSTASESANSVITDEDGNVYTAGTFRNTTFLNGGGNPDIQINSLMGTTSPNTYVAKYDECGDLLWVANTTNANNCQGTSITYDKNSNMVYIGGTINGNSTFNSSQSAGSLCTSGFSQSVSSPEPQGYVAQYDANTGCLYFVQLLDFGVETKVNTLTINESNGKLFVGGSSLASGSTIEQRGFVRKYSPVTNLGTSNTLGAVIWSLTDVITTPLTYSVVNDLDYHESTGRVFIIGTMLKGNMLSNGSSTSTVFSTSPVSDAFMAVYNDLTAPTMLHHRAGGAVVGNYMTGEGIAVDNVTGWPYFTGSYSGTVTNPFSLGSVGAANLTGVGQNKAYIVSFKLTGTLSAWSRSTFSNSSSGSSYGRDIVAHNHKTYCVGEFSLASLGANTLAGWINYFGGMGTVSSPTKHVWVIGFSETGTATFGNATTALTVTTPDIHSATAIETNRNGYSFVTGQFSKYMGYLSGTPSSGPLVSTGPPNAFVMRVDESNIHFRSEEIEETESAIALSSSINDHLLKVYPNPTNGQISIILEDFDAENTGTLFVYSPIGSLMQELPVSSEKMNIDLSSYENGIYLVSYSNGRTTQVVRVSKTN